MDNCLNLHIHPTWLHLTMFISTQPRMNCAVSNFPLEELQAAAHKWYRKIRKDRFRRRLSLSGIVASFKTGYVKSSVSSEEEHMLKELRTVKELRTKSKLSDDNSRNLTIFYLPKKGALVLIIPERPLVIIITAHVIKSCRNDINYIKLLNSKHNGMQGTKELELIFRTSKIFTDLTSTA